MTTSIDKEFKGQVNTAWGLTIQTTNKVPEVAKRIFKTKSAAETYVKDINDTAIEGLILTVVEDDISSSNNGAYFVKSIKTSETDEKGGELVKLSDSNIDASLFTVVSDLPTASADALNKIYLVEDASNVSGNKYIEYICVETVSGETETYAWEKLGEYRATVDLSPYYKKTEVDGLISNIEDKLIFGGGENNTIVGKNGHESNFKFRPSTSFESDINSKGTSVISQNLDKIEFKNSSKSVTLNSNGFYYGKTSDQYNQIATINDINKISVEIPTNISDFEGEYNIINPLSNTFNVETLYNDENEKQGITLQYKHRDDGGGLGASIKVGSDEVYDGAIKISSGDYYREVGFNTLFINANGSYIFHSAKDEVPDGALVESNRIATKGDISGSYVSKNDIKSGNVDNITGETDGLVASVKHTHNYIYNNGFTTAGDDGVIDFTNGFNFEVGDDAGIDINNNRGLSYSSTLYTSESSVRVTDSAVTIDTKDTDVEIDGSGFSVEVKEDGVDTKHMLVFNDLGNLKVDGTKVSLEGHTHNGLEKIAQLEATITAMQQTIQDLQAQLNALKAKAITSITTDNNPEDMVITGRNDDGSVSITLKGISNIAFDEAKQIDGENTAQF